MRRAQEITDQAFSNILKFIRPGQTEQEIAASSSTRCSAWVRRR